jgi:hypothetical protein
VPVTAPDVPSLGTVPYTEGRMHTRHEFASVAPVLSISDARFRRNA